MAERRGQLFFWSGVLFLLLLFSLFSSLRHAIFAPILTVDSRQMRQNVAMHIPQDSFTINQTFVSRQDGLQEIEVMLVRYGEPDPVEDGRFTLSLYNDEDEMIATATYLTRHLAHNQALVLQLPTALDSVGQHYRLELSGSSDNTVTVRGYDIDSYSAGRAELRPTASAAVPEIRAADIWFVTRNRLTWSNTWWALLTTSWYQGYLLPIIGAVLLLPGALLLRVAPLRRLISDPLARWGTAVALGLAIWPLLWQFSSLLGWHWSRSTLLVLLGVGWSSWLGLLLWHWWREGRAKLWPGQAWRREHSALLLLITVALIVRLLAVRDVNAPLWVDASRHGLITAVMAGSGQTISNYSPYLPVDTFPYHSGFHSLSATLTLVSSAPLNELLLYLGQLLNALTPLTVYAGLWIITRDRRASLLAAFLVALPFFFPAYYATWGRFTQLAALLLLPVLLGMAWQIGRGAKEWRRLWWATAMLLAGLFLLHVRVFAYFLPFPLLVWLSCRGRGTKELLLAGGGALLLLLPRLSLLIDLTLADASFTSSAAGAYFQFPTSYYLAGGDRYFIWLAGLMLILMLAAALDRRRRSVLPLVLTGWVLLQFLLVGGGVLGYPVPTYLNLNSMYITLFVPLALYLAALAGEVAPDLAALASLAASGAAISWPEYCWPS